MILAIQSGLFVHTILATWTPQSMPIILVIYTPPGPYNTGKIDASVRAYKTGFLDASLHAYNTGYIDASV
jgi:hypothetical protein